MALSIEWPLYFSTVHWTCDSYLVTWVQEVRQSK